MIERHFGMADLWNGRPVPLLITPFSFHPNFLSWRTFVMADRYTVSDAGTLK
jgi:hypothetical protein